jgi:predicted nuclease with TOPRIM domain
VSKALKMQQDDEDRKNEIVIEGFEDKIKKLEDSLKENDSLLCSAKGSLAESHSQNEKLSKELEEARTTLEKNLDRFNREFKALNARIEAENKKNVKLSETITNLPDKCFGFATQCIARLKGILNSVRAASEEVTLSVEVITGHGDFCALVASRGTVAAFMKVGCNHVSAFN